MVGGFFSAVCAGAAGEVEEAVGAEGDVGDAVGEAAAVGVGGAEPDCGFSGVSVGADGWGAPDGDFVEGVGVVAFELLVGGEPEACVGADGDAEGLCAAGGVEVVGGRRLVFCPVISCKERW